MLGCYDTQMEMPVFQLLKRSGAGFLDLLLPPRCPSCKAIVARDGSFCAPCWSRLHFVTAPMCACCGLPFPYSAGDGALCGACAQTPPPFDRARAALVYNGASAGLVLALKHGDRTGLARIMAGMMARAAAPMLAERPLLVPVPLHAARLRTRRFNQAALLAARIARRADLPVLAAALARVRDTPISRSMSRRQRAENVRGAIRVRPGAAARIRGAHVLLVDDVMTTGATAEACARALRRAGAKRIDIVTFARVTHDTVEQG
ncbi:ComF family protein [Sphingosinicella soli]|uniref:ComF family protein n=1 Tax=Sphingosinicella soli TaxID=333708 RepID=A0A7W7B0Z9_9SPHN|nr:ComF family protein [Sphingosinicella soli]MBB4632050.1 ComF family protein [Sphingosinicella soli]